MKKYVAIFILVLMAGFVIADNEYKAAQTAGQTLYVIQRAADGNQVWSDAGAAWETWNDANIANYDIPMTDLDGGSYTADFNANITAGDYPYIVYIQAGVSPNTTDNLTASGIIYWSGSDEITLSDLSTLTIADVCDTFGEPPYGPVTETAEIIVSQWDANSAVGAAIAADVDHPAEIWYVSLNGDDSDGKSPVTAYNTIGQAISNASNGDIIYVYSGTYDETVDFDTANLSATLEGIGRPLIYRTGSGEEGIILEDNCILKNIRVSTTDKSAYCYGVYASGKNNIVIEDCDIFGAFDGIYFASCVNVHIRNSKIRSNYDSFTQVNCGNILVEGCIIETDGGYSNSIDFVAVRNGGYGVFDNCIIRAYRDDTSSNTVTAVFAGIRTVMNNCVIRADTGSSDTGNQYGVSIANSAYGIQLNSCVIRTSTTGSGTGYDLFNAAGTIAVDNCLYDDAKTSGTITDRAYTIQNKTDNLPADTNSVLAGIAIDANAAPDANTIRDAIFNKTGLTTGGDWSFGDIIKYEAAWMLGKWIDGNDTTKNISDAEDPNTTVLYYTPSPNSPYKVMTRP